MGRHKSRVRASVTLIIGLTLAVVVAMGTRAFAAESGFFLCAYGSCPFYYWDCESASVEPLGGGNCRVTVNVIDGCSISYWCEPEGGFYWEDEGGSYGTTIIER